MDNILLLILSGGLIQIFTRNDVEWRNYARIYQDYLGLSGEFIDRYEFYNRNKNEKNWRTDGLGYRFPTKHIMLARKPPSNELEQIKKSSSALMVYTSTRDINPGSLIVLLRSALNVIDFNKKMAIGHETETLRMISKGYIGKVRRNNPELPGYHAITQKGYVQMIGALSVLAQKLIFANPKKLMQARQYLDQVPENTQSLLPDRFVTLAHIETTPTSELSDELLFRELLFYGYINKRGDTINVTPSGYLQIIQAFDYYVGYVLDAIHMRIVSPQLSLPFDTESAAIEIKKAPSLLRRDRRRLLDQEDLEVIPAASGGASTVVLPHKSQTTSRRSMPIHRQSGPRKAPALPQSQQVRRLAPPVPIRKRRK